jgi:DNA-binding SARP family transcriptional activator
VTSGRRLRIDVLGPIRVVDPENRDRTPAGSLQRRLLALLVLRRGRVVTADSAIDALWPSTRPDDPVAALHNHLFRLRRGLPSTSSNRSPTAIGSTPPGWSSTPTAWRQR